MTTARKHGTDEPSESRRRGAPQSQVPTAAILQVAVEELLDERDRLATNGLVRILTKGDRER